MTRTCECGKWIEDADGIGGWRVTTDGPKNALTWWCPECWARRVKTPDLAGRASTTGCDPVGCNPTEGLGGA